MGEFGWEYNKKQELIILINVISNFKSIQFIL